MVQGDLVLSALLLLLATLFCWRWRRSCAGGAPRPGAAALAIGFGTNFFDTLGIGSFAPTTSLFRLLRLVPDERIPGTLNVGHTLPTIVQALIFIGFVRLEPLTLAAMIGAAVLGAWLGAGVVSRWPRRPIRLGMGLALLCAAALLAAANLGLLPTGGEKLGLEGPELALAVAVNAGLGALMTVGVGLYAPCMVLLALLGMNPVAAFPVMMGSCAFLMPVGSLRFIERGSYSLAAAVGLAVGGIPAVLLAAFVVKSLPLEAVRWLVVGVACYTSAMLLHAAFRGEGAAALPETP